MRQGCDDKEQCMVVYICMWFDGLCVCGEIFEVFREDASK